MNTDPVADMLTRIRNACRARKQRVVIPSSKLKLELCRILQAEGFIGDFTEVKGKIQGQNVIDIELRYDSSSEPVIQNLKRVSRPGLRRYLGADEVPKVRGGQGVLILTTSKGVMTDRDARKQRVGGEALCTVW
jgi:small subunit ribosomal protein S8